jgi:hypothetical protein
LASSCGTHAAALLGWAVAEGAVTALSVALGDNVTPLSARLADGWPSPAGPAPLQAVTAQATAAANAAAHLRHRFLPRCTPRL